MAIDDAVHAGTTSDFEDAACVDGGFDITDASGGDAMSWANRLVAAASDYEAIDAESLAGLGPGD